MHIEQACESDIPALLSLLKSLFAIERDFTADPDRQRRGLRRLIDEGRERANVLVARVDGNVVGMASGQLVVSTAQGTPSVWIEDVVVADDVRGTGIGRALLDAMLGWAASKGATRAQLLADKDNAAALCFYQRCGFQATSLVALRTFELDRSGTLKKTGAW